MAAHFAVVGRLEHHTGAGNVAAVPDLAHGTLRVEGLALLGLCGEQRREIGVAELFGVAGEKGKELHGDLLCGRLTREISRHLFMLSKTD